MSVGFTREQLREAIGASRTWAETLRRLGYCVSGGNHATVKKYAHLWSIDSSHFDAGAVRDVLVHIEPAGRNYASGR